MTVFLFLFETALCTEVLCVIMRSSKFSTLGLFHCRKTVSLKVSETSEAEIRDESVWNWLKDTWIQHLAAGTEKRGGGKGSGRCQRWLVNNCEEEARGWLRHSGGQPVSGPLAQSLWPATEMPASLTHTHTHSCWASHSLNIVFLASAALKTTFSAHFCFVARVTGLF